MQEFALNSLRLPISALDRRGTDDWPSEIETPDDRMMAQFEELMPSDALDPERQADPGTADTSIAGIGMLPSGSAGATVSQRGAEWHQARFSHLDSDAPSAEFSVHHSRIGIVHVQQSSGRDGGSITLRTDDVLLRERLRNATAGLQAVMTDASGRGPDVAIES